jgi:hypothetical protein
VGGGVGGRGGAGLGTGGGGGSGSGAGGAGCGAGAAGRSIPSNESPSISMIFLHFRQRILSSLPRTASAGSR